MNNWNKKKLTAFNYKMKIIFTYQYSVILNFLKKTLKNLKIILN